jgi:hypothetical protein
MKQTKLDLLGYLKKAQYCCDEGFTISNSSEMSTLSIGIYVKERDERFWFSISHIKALAYRKEKIDVTPYHGETKKLAEEFNKIIEGYVPFKFPNVITRVNKNIKGNKHVKQKR